MKDEFYQPRLNEIILLDDGWDGDENCKRVTDVTVHIAMRILELIEIREEHKMVINPFVDEGFTGINIEMRNFKGHFIIDIYPDEVIVLLSRDKENKDIVPAREIKFDMEVLKENLKIINE